MQRNKRNGDSADIDSDFGARTFWKSMKKNTHKEDRRAGKMFSKDPLPNLVDEDREDLDEIEDFERIGPKGKKR
ncbi:MAG: hypothetical protein CVV64_13265 [Candidatus Wallbacteria bacterium HGW-Wallbacteria-1]|uniref:Uncharacterized protein n=1 Tax=Candidatus Wallbacteria bacterium HGW-Wallbacteria-1 TaxID=2013854 RepID=A0A2N1PMR6_9BACT|nr:MAG: hypothetical protein CVV64_13265 [Candidatus Wallbacteria bacterium HGW-Wallbacteria-1]